VSKKVNIVKIVYFTCVLHTLVDKKHKKKNSEHFLDRGFLEWQALGSVPVVLCLTNSTNSSAIYKMKIGLAHYLNLKGSCKTTIILELLFFVYVLHTLVNKNRTTVVTSVT
jgi:hypothetical protein